MMFVHDKKWIDHLVIAVGAIVGLIIIVGLVLSLRPFFSSSDDSSLATDDSTCVQCVTVRDNNTRRFMDLSKEITLSLTESAYPQSNLVIISNPEGILRQVESTTADATDDTWQIVYLPVLSGTVELIVKSPLGTVPDFHVSLDIQ